MKTLRLLPLELGRILRSRLAWLVMALTVLSPLAGLTFYKPTAINETMLSIHLSNPALAGGLVGGILFALFAIYECDRVKRGQMNTLMDAVVSPLTAAFIRMCALLCTAMLTLGITMLAWLPYTIYATGAVFDMPTYVLAYLIFMGLALLLSILLAISAYQFTGRFDLSVVLFAAMAGLSLTVWRDQWQLCWLNPCVWGLSDDFSSFRLFRSVAYMRLTWILGMTGVWALSYLCIRRYGKGLVGSALRNARRLYRPILATLLLACCGWAFINQPFVDHSNPDTTAMKLLGIEDVAGVTWSKLYVDLHPDTKRGEISGTASYLLQNTTGAEMVVPFMTRPGCRITAATVDEKPVPFEVGDYQEFGMALLNVTIPAEKELELKLEYSGFLQEQNAFGMAQGSTEISDRYLYLRKASIAPVIRVAVAENGALPSSIIDLTLPGHMTVIPFGTAEAELQVENNDGSKVWRIEDTMNSATIYAGDYVREDLSASGINAQFYYGRKHQPIMEQFKAADAMRAVLEYCTEHYGTLPMAADGTLKLVQSRISTGGHAEAGASLMNEPDFAANNLSDSNKGAVPGEVILHETAHQWWGVGKMVDQGTDNLWSAEGLTVYTTYRMVKALWGEANALKYVEKWKREANNYYLNFYVRHPSYLQALPEDKQLTITNGLASVRMYCEMPLKILKAEQLVGGEAAMDQILHDLFNRELDPMFPYLTYQDFLDACGLTEEDLNLD